MEKLIREKSNNQQMLTT